MVETRNGLYKPDSFYGRGTRILKMFNIGRLDGTWDLERVDKVELSDAEEKQFGLRKGDILFNRVNSRELVGKCAVVDAATAGAVFESKNIRVTVDRGRVDPWWVVAWLNSEAGRVQIESLAKQAIGQATLNRADLDQIEILLPPLSTQRNITARLREQLHAIETARRAVEAQIEAAGRLPSAVLDSTFAGHEADEWPRGRLGTVLIPRNDIVHPRNKPVGRAQFVGLEHVEPHTGRRLGAIEVQQSELTGRKARFFPSDIVYGYLRPYLNKVWIAEFAGLCSVDQYVYQVAAERADTRFVAWFLRSPTYLSRAPVDVSPGQLPRIRMEEVAAVEIGLPPLEIQRAVAARLDAELAATESLRASLQQRLRGIKRLPGALLREAFASNKPTVSADESDEVPTPGACM